MRKPKRSNRTLWGIKRPDGSVVQDVRAARTRKDAAQDFFDNTEEGAALIDELENSDYWYSGWRGDLIELWEHGYSLVKVRVMEAEK